MAKKPDPEDEVVEAEIVPLQPVDLDGQAPPPQRRDDIYQLVQQTVPNIVAGSAAQAAQWAKLYGLPPQRYRIVYSSQHLQGLAPNRDIIVLVGSFRQDKSWELCEMVQAIGSMGIRVIHGGAF